MNSKHLEVKFLTLYPEVFPGYLGFALAKKAYDKGIWDYSTINIRDFSLDKHKTVDDKTFGGGRGLLMKPDVLGRAIDFILKDSPNTHLVYPSPKGKTLTSEKSKELSEKKSITFICGHFEGIDQRIIDKYSPEEISIGDYILSGGELSSMVILDSVLRFVPNVIKSDECVAEESFSHHLLEYPQYTKPFLWEEFEVPKVLVSGNHKEISLWRKKQSEEITKKIRPDLWEKYKKIKD